MGLILLNLFWMEELMMVMVESGLGFVKALWMNVHVVGDELDEKDG